MSSSFPSEFVWDPNALRWRSRSTGRFLSQAATEQALKQFAAATADELRRLGAGLLAGELSLGTWQDAMAQAIKESYIAVTLITNGGPANVTPSQWAATEAAIAEQLAYLERYAQQIAEGQQKPNGTLPRRNELYAHAAKSWFWEQFQRMRQALGYGEERRVLTPGESCEDCVRYAAQGWVPIGTLPQPGQGSRCRTRCRCRKEFRRGTR